MLSLRVRGKHEVPLLPVLNLVGLVGVAADEVRYGGGLQMLLPQERLVFFQGDLESGVGEEGLSGCARAKDGDVLTERELLKLPEARPQVLELWRKVCREGLGPFGVGDEKYLTTYVVLVGYPVV